MWRLASAAVLIAVVIVAAASTLTSRADTPTPTPDASPSESPSPSPPPSPSPSPEPAPEPSPEPLPPPPPAPADPQPAGPPSASIDAADTGSLRPGDWVQITGTGSCLNMRWEPRIPVGSPDGQAYDNVVNCLPDGFIGRLDASGWGYTTPPVSSDGRWWWHVIGQGWAADEWLTFHHQGGLPWPERPDLAGAGLIAYIGGNGGIWLMNGDGTGQRQVVTRSSDSEYFYELAWAPSGDRLSYSVNGGPAGATRIIDPEGNLVVELAGLTGARWSPDGTRLSALRYHSAAGLGDNRSPVIYDLNAGQEIPVGAASSLDRAPAWSPDSRFVTFVCTSSLGFTTAADGSSVETRLDCGDDGLRIVPATGGDPRVILPFTSESGVYYRNPSWSRDGSRIAVVNHQEENGCRGYTLVNVQTGALGRCIAFPTRGSLGGGCGWPADASEWSTDGRRLIFSYSMGSGSNGIHVVDVTTDARTVLPGQGTALPSLQAAGSNLTYSAGNHIWVAGLDGSNLSLLAEGHSPAWQPLP